MIHHKVLQFEPPKSAAELHKLGKQLQLSKQILGMGLNKDPIEKVSEYDKKLASSSETKDALHETFDKCKSALFSAIASKDPDQTYKPSTLNNGDADNLSENSDPDEDGQEGVLWGGIDKSI
jgi:hypothetical protein